MAHDPLTDFARRLHGWIRAGGEPLREEPAFNRAALELFQLQCVANEVCRRWVRHRGLRPGDVTCWTAIPALPAVAFKEAEVTALPPPARTRVFHSSGTTQHRPGRHFHGAESLALYEASLAAWFAPHLLPEGRLVTVVSLTPPPPAAPHSSLVHMLATVLHRHGDAGSAFAGLAGAEGWTVDLAALRGCLGPALAARRPVLLAGTAFNFVHVLDALAADGRTLPLPPGSRVMETGGYKGRSHALARPELHAALAAAFAVPEAAIVREYGMCELGSQAYDLVACRSGPRRFRFPPWARARVISPETGDEVAVGETGRLCIHDLANVWSAAAVQTEDLAVRLDDGFELLGRAPAAEPRGCSLLAS